MTILSILFGTISKISFGPTRQRRICLFVGAWFQILDPPQAELRLATHKGDLTRRKAPHSGETRSRHNLEPESYF